MTLQQKNYIEIAYISEVLKISKKIGLDKTVNDALKTVYGLSDPVISQIAACAGTPAQIEACIKKILSANVVSKKQDDAWEFLYHFVIVG